jgi:diguanylate cyclase (GGDEF)-like protein/PAS domain S-box-containing protein
MKLDILTLAFISSLVFLTELIALFVQYKLNRTYRGVSWWLLGFTFWAVGVLFMPMVAIKPFQILALFANPLVVSGQIFLYIGIARFLNQKENRWTLMSIFIGFTSVYYYFIFAHNDLFARTLVLTTVLAGMSFMTAFEIYKYKGRLITDSANLTALVFFAYACFSAIRVMVVLFSPPIQTYSDQELVFELSFIIPIVTSLLWTFGFIIMMNQRLHAENREEKEKLQLIFTQSKLAEHAVRESEELYRSILNASPDDITITDLKGHILMISPAARKMFGYAPDYDQFIGKQLLDYIVPEERTRAKANIVRMCKGDHTGTNEYHGVRKDGSIFDIEVNSGLILGADQQPAKMLFIVRDITERKQAEELIQQLVQQLEVEKKTAELNANTDSLTGVANRRYFDQVLNTEFHRLKRTGAPLSLIMLDVDHFKNFNDSYGHLAGDDCLRQIGTTLKTFVRRASDFVARYGGEEFVVVLAETDPHGAEILAERIRTAIEALAIPHAGSEVAQVVTVSLGVVTVYPSGMSSTEQIMALADKAMYRAKQAGRNRTSVAAEYAFLEA